MALTPENLLKKLRKLDTNCEWLVGNNNSISCELATTRDYLLITILLICTLFYHLCIVFVIVYLLIIFFRSPNCGTIAPQGIGFGSVCVKFKTFVCDLCELSLTTINLL